MTNRLQLDPTAAALLREIAADPRSSLLRVTPAAAAKTLVAHTPIVRESATFLTRAERELLRSHRCEVAALLREAYTAKLYGEAKPEYGYVLRVTSERVIELRQPAEWVLAAGARLAELPEPLRHEDASLLVARCVGERGWHHASVEQLVTAAQRLEPRDHGRIYAGLALVEQQQTAVAERIFRELAGRAARPIDSAYALVDLGMVRELLGDPVGALEANLEALKRSADFALARINTVVFCTITGRSNEFDESQSWIEAHLRANDESVRSIQAAQLCMWRPVDAGNRVPRDLRRRAQQVCSHSGATVKELLHVFL